MAIARPRFVSAAKGDQTKLDLRKLLAQAAANTAKLPKPSANPVATARSVADRD